MFAANEDPEIFEDPDGQSPFIKEEGEDTCGEQLSERDLSNLDSHQRSELVKQITTRVAKTIHQFDEESRDEIGDLRVLEDQANRQEITKLILKQERRAKEVDRLHKEHAKSLYDNEHSNMESSWQDEENHIIDEQHLMSVEIDNSQRNVDGLLQLVNETQENAIVNLNDILQKLEQIVENFQMKSNETLLHQHLQQSGANSIIKDQMNTLKESIENIKSEKNELEYTLALTTENLQTLNCELMTIKKQSYDTLDKFQDLQKKLNISDGKNIDLNIQCQLLSDQVERQQLDLAGMESMQKEVGRTADLKAQLKVFEKRANNAMLKSKEYHLEMIELNKSNEFFKKNINTLELRLNEEKEKIIVLNNKREKEIKSNAFQSTDSNNKLHELENTLKMKYHKEIDELKSKINENDVKSNIIIDDLKSKSPSLLNSPMSLLAFNSEMMFLLSQIVFL